MEGKHLSFTIVHEKFSFREVVYDGSPLCIIGRKKGGEHPKTYYDDFDCDGSLDRVHIGPDGDYTTPSDKEVVEYGALLDAVSDWIKINRRYQPDYPKEKFIHKPDYFDLEVNRKYMQLLYDAVVNTELSVYSGGIRWFGVSLGNGHSVEFSLEQSGDGSGVTNCMIKDNSRKSRGKRVLLDQKCDAFFEIFKQDAKAAQPAGHGYAVIYDSVLRDLRMWAEFAARHYPRHTP